MFQLKQDFDGVIKLFKGESTLFEKLGVPTRGMNGLKVKHEKEIYNQPAQFKDVMEFRYYLGAHQCFQSADRKLFGTVFEVGQADIYGKTQAYAVEKRDQIATSLRHIPQDVKNPYVLQTFCQDDPIGSFIDEVIDYQSQFGEDSEYRREYQQMWGEHFNNLSKPGGYFKNKKTGSRWGGIIRKVRFVLYRNMESFNDDLYDSPEDEIQSVTEQVMTALETKGIECRLYDPADVYAWLVPWFNPHPEGEDSGRSLVEHFPLDYKKGEDYYGLDDRLIKHYPYFDLRNRCVRFNDNVHTCLVGVDKQHKNPPIGVWTTSANENGTRLGTAMERIPEGCVVCSTTVFKPSFQVESKMDEVKKDSKGNDERTTKAKEDIGDAKLAMDNDNALYPSFMYVYVKGESAAQLKRNRGKVMTVLRSLRFDPIELNADLVPIDTYTKYLPFSYKPHYDKHLYRNRLQWDRLITNLIPMYGSSTGTGQHGMLFLNPEGMPFSFDLLNKQGKKQNSNLSVIAPPGSGKSALAQQMMASVKATHNPYFIVIDVNGSFKLHQQYFEEKGYSTRYIELSANSDMSLPLFEMAVPAYLDELKKGALGMGDDADEFVLFDDDLTQSEHESIEKSEDDDEDERDPMGEMVLTAKMMITKGMESAEAAFAPNDFNMLNNAILMAAKTIHEKGETLVRPIDVVNALWRINDDGVMLGQERTYRQERRDRAADMAESMMDYTRGVKGKFFNREGEGWPDVDLLVLDLKMLAKDGYEDILYMTYIGLMNFINTMADKRRGKGRQTVVVNDEAHVINMVRTLALFKRKSIKMWRKCGVWLWDLTQNVKDYPDEALDILNVSESMILFKLQQEEIDRLKTIRSISNEEEAMIKNLTTVKGEYAEGIILSEMLRATFRSVPPAWYLALGQTEEHEYAERVKLMNEHGITEVQAAHRLADQVERNRCTAQQSSR